MYFEQRQFFIYRIFFNSRLVILKIHDSSNQVMKTKLGEHVDELISMCESQCADKILKWDKTSTCGYPERGYSVFEDANIPCEYILAPRIPGIILEKTTKPEPNNFRAGIELMKKFNQKYDKYERKLIRQRENIGLAEDVPRGFYDKESKFGYALFHIMGRYRDNTQNR